MPIKSLEDQLKHLKRRASRSKPPLDYPPPINRATHAENISLVALDRLYPYSKHPFKPYSEEKLAALAESIERDGLHQPIIVRPLPDYHGWEILAGHNRVEAMRRLGKSDIPAIVRAVDENQAALVVVNTNLEQREKLLPSEKAFAYKLQMEALGSNVSMVEYQIDTQRKGEILSESHRDSYAQVFRYIRLTLLTPELLDLLDQERYPIMAGYEISFLNVGSQQAVRDYFFGKSAMKLSLKHAQAIRAAFHSGKPITAETIPGILQKPKKTPGPVTYRFSHKELKKQYPLPDGFDLTSFIHEKLHEAFCR
jgi:ParB family chromosome partitioning protein